MNNTLRYVESELTYDRGSPAAEWEVVVQLLSQFSAERESIIRWLFEEYNGYIDTRSRAGLELVECNPTKGWDILKLLISSVDPDDRDTALGVLELLDNDNAAQMALPLLNDEWTYIRLEAAIFVRRFYPENAARCLEDLLQQEMPSVKEEARKLLAEMGKNR